MGVLAEIAVSLCLIAGSGFALVGSVGLVKLDNPMSRLHGPTKTSTLGIGALLVASMLHAFAFEAGSLHELLILAFLFVTAPIVGHFLAKAHIHALVSPDALPKPPRDDTWAVLAKPKRE